MNLERGLFSVFVSYVELYNDKIYDLLEDPPAREEGGLRCADCVFNIPMLRLSLLFIQRSSRNLTHKPLSVGFNPVSTRREENA